MSSFARTCFVKRGSRVHLFSGIMEPEKLIELVREHPVLYDTNHADYMRSKLKDELWEQIGAELDTDSKVVKEQWRKLRECHREAMRRQKRKKDEDASWRQKPWTYQSQMEFLLPYMKNRLTQTNWQNSSSSSNPPIVDDDINYAVWIEPDKVLPSSSNEENISEPTFHEVPHKKIKHRGNSLSQEQISQWSERRATSPDKLRPQLLDEIQQCNHQNEALYTFFQSMYAITKGLPGQYQRQVRKKVFEAVTQAEEQYENAITQNASPSQ